MLLLPHRSSCSQWGEGTAVSWQPGDWAGDVYLEAQQPSAEGVRQPTTSLRTQGAHPPPGCRVPKPLCSAPLTGAAPRHSPSRSRGLCSFFLCFLFYLEKFSVSLKIQARLLVPPVSWPTLSLKTWHLLPHFIVILYLCLISSARFKVEGEIRSLSFSTYPISACLSNRSNEIRKIKQNPKNQPCQFANTASLRVGAGHRIRVETWGVLTQHPHLLQGHHARASGAHQLGA